MKYSIILPAFLLFINLLASSCSDSISPQSSSTTTIRKATGPTAYVGEKNIIAMPLIADLEIEDRMVIGTFNDSKVTEEYAKGMAVQTAVRNAKADVLVEPRFDITIIDQAITVEVKGHPAHYKNFRTPKAPSEFIGRNQMETTKPKSK